MFGYREGPTKVIFNATTIHTDVYDLACDPMETSRLELPERELAVYHQKIASWVQPHNAYLASIMGELDKDSLAQYK